MEQERRKAPRYPFLASIEMREDSSADKRTERVKELSLNGCFVEMEQPFAVGTKLGVKVFTETEYFESQASVIYSQPEGMGLMFRAIKPYYVAVLRKWLLAAMMAKKQAER